MRLLMVHLPSANCLGIGNSQHDAVHDHPPIGPPQGYSIRHPPNQRRISVKNWHKSLGEIWSMALVITGTIGLFRHIQESLNHANGKRVTLPRGVHTNLSELQWLSEDLANHPTCIYEVNPPPNCRWISLRIRNNVWESHTPGTEYCDSGNAGAA